MTPNLHYLAPVRMPTEKAHGLQIVQNCEALSGQGAVVTLYPARRVQPPDLRGVDPFAYYDVPPVFNMRYVPNIDLIAHIGPDNLLARGIFTLHLATYIAALLVMLRGTGPDAIYYSRDPIVLNVVRRFKPARQLFWEIHSLSSSPQRRQRQAQLINQIGGAISITGHMAQTLIDLGADPARVMVAPDGFRAARFAGMPTREQARAAFNLPPDAFMVGYMGRLHTLNMDKGVGDVLQAIAKQPELPLHLLLVGGPDEMVEQYRAEWGKLGLPVDRFHSLGQIPAAEIPRALAAFDVMTMPFPWTEHFAYYASPIKLFEYMAGGRPIVATDLPSTTEIVTHEETALLVPPSDVDALAGALVRLYDDAVLRQRLAENAQKIVYDRYTWAARAANILAFIQENRQP